MRKVEPIPWIVEKDFEFVEGDLLLAINKGYFCLPEIVVVRKNGKVESCFGKFKSFKTSDFDYYAYITNP